MILAYMISAFLSFLGIPAGMLIAYFTKEELKAGKRYFEIIRKVLLSLVFFALFYSYRVNIAASMIASIIFFTLLLRFRIQNARAVYAVLGIIFYISSRMPEAMGLVASSIFLYGIPEGTLFIRFLMKRKKSFIAKTFFSNYISYLAVTVLLYFII